MYDRDRSPYSEQSSLCPEGVPLEVDVVLYGIYQEWMFGMMRFLAEKFIVPAGKDFGDALIHTLEVVQGEWLSNGKATWNDSVNEAIHSVRSMPCRFDQNASTLNWARCMTGVIIDVLDENTSSGFHWLVSNVNYESAEFFAEFQNSADAILWQVCRKRSVAIAYKKHCGTPLIEFSTREWAVARCMTCFKTVFEGK